MPSQNNEHCWRQKVIRSSIRGNYYLKATGFIDVIVVDGEYPPKRVSIVCVGVGTDWLEKNLSQEEKVDYIIDRLLGKVDFAPVV